MSLEAITNGELKWWGSPAIVYVTTPEQFQEFSYPADPQRAFAMRRPLPYPRHSL